VTYSLSRLKEACLSTRASYCSSSHIRCGMIRGLRNQAFVTCQHPFELSVCNFVVHERCLKTVVSACSSIATNLIKNPVAHSWSEAGHFKRKFCNVCRRRLEDSQAIRCEICEYYAHEDCSDFSVSDCKECATYGPHKVNAVQYHHWREGNLPANSKCLACKKTCWSSECLSGMRCEWCGVTAHASCYRLLPTECNFGSLREIMLPPNCLTIPRMDVPMETVLGIKGRGDKRKRLHAEKINKILEPSNFEKLWESGAGFFSRLTKSGRTISEEWPSSGDTATTDDDERQGPTRSPKDKDSKDKEKDLETEIIRVFDGNSSMKRKLYRTISVPKNAPAQAILSKSGTISVPKNAPAQAILVSQSRGQISVPKNAPAQAILNYF
ncbi:diacylglycerol kinase (ATP), partial [Mytilus galloprovincialis]